MTKSTTVFAALAAFFVLGIAVEQANAQGCCKAGLCRIPQIPSSSSSIPSYDRSIDSQSTAAVRPASTAASLQQMTLSNPAGSRASVEYTLDGRTYVLEPGMTLTFQTTQARKIEFKRGSGDTLAKYRVSRGGYEFAQTDNGWELYRLAAN